jgi:uncharacterized lipoprotein YbaY
MCTEIRWTTHAGDIAGVTVYSPTVDLPDRIRLTIGHDLHLHIPPAEARCIAMALIDAADAPAQVVARKVIPINSAPPAGLYHDPDETPEAA